MEFSSFSNKLLNLWWFLANSSRSGWKMRWEIMQSWVLVDADCRQRQTYILMSKALGFVRGTCEPVLKRLFWKVKVLRFNWQRVCTFRSFEVCVLKPTFTNSCLEPRNGKLFCHFEWNGIWNQIASHEQPQTLLMLVNSQLSSLESCPTETSSSGPSTIFAKSSSINWRTFSRWLRDTKAARLWSSAGSKCNCKLCCRLGNDCQVGRWP